MTFWTLHIHYVELLLTLFRMNLRIKQKRIPDIAPDNTGDRNQEATSERHLKDS